MGGFSRFDYFGVGVIILSLTIALPPLPLRRYGTCCSSGEKVGIVIDLLSLEMLIFPLSIHTILSLSNINQPV